VVLYGCEAPEKNVCLKTSVYFKNTTRGLMVCVHCTQLETLSSGRSGEVLGSHSDSCPFSASCHNSHSCCFSQLCYMETLHVGLVCIKRGPYYRCE
jgi:hypothetical protein